MKRCDIAIIFISGIVVIALTVGGYFLTYKIIKGIIHYTVKEECLNEK